MLRTVVTTSEANRTETWFDGTGKYPITSIFKLARCEHPSSATCYLHYWLGFRLTLTGIGINVA
jgi:hypothetical protein